MSTPDPVIPGFYPDPSICRVGTNYYLANSSFEYRPGVPIHSSVNLTDWTFVGNALTSESQLPDSAGIGSSGIYAPVLRHHGNRFWLVTTDVVNETPEQDIQHAEFVEGPWSDPVRTSGAVGIDPDLAWDGDVCYLTWAGADEDGSQIVQARIDPFTGVLAEEPRPLWSGTGLAFPEGPHIIRRGDWWYLLIAEGGTERGHCVSVARGLSPEGPFVGNPANPILSHRSLADPVQNTGHSDLVECVDGSWALVYLGVRPRGMTPGFHVNGRETFVARVDWVDDWPVIVEGQIPSPPMQTSFVDEFTGASLHGRWVSPGVFPTSIAQMGPGGLAVTAEQEGFIGVRTRDASWSAETEVHVDSGVGSLAVRIDGNNMYAIEVDARSVAAVVTIGGRALRLSELPLDRSDATHLRIRALPEPARFDGPSGPDRIEFAVRIGGSWHPLGEFDGRYLSTEVAGGFTGRIVGMAARDGRSIFRQFTYTALTP